MSCEHVQELISTFLDGQVPGGETEKLLAHVKSCRECSASLATQQNLRSALRKLDHVPVPAALTANLRVIASHERARRLSHASIASRAAYLYGRAKLTFDNMMRPLALPFAGGLLSAMVIFGMLVPTLTFQHVFADELLFTYPDGEVVELGANGPSIPHDTRAVPRIERGDASTPENANVVELVIDENGKVFDWSLASGQLTPALKDIIMFSTFRPATLMGVPTSGKVKAVQDPAPPTPRVRS